jgi:choline-sulfatase
MPRTPPNIICLFPDEWRWDGIRALGLSPAVMTPNIDRIAAEGAAFTNCHCCSPLCMPARASMMTGQYVREHGQWANDTAGADSSGPSHVRRIRDEAGYHTAVIGKLHVYKGKGLDGPEILRRWGFEHADEIPGPMEASGRKTSWSQWVGPEKFARFQAYVREFKKTYEGRNPWDTPAPDLDPWRLSTQDHIDTYVGNSAAAWIRDYRGRRPFYLQVNFPGPHYPIDSTTEMRERFGLSDIPLGIYEKPRDPVSPVVRWSGTSWCNIQDMTPDQMRRVQLIYFAKQYMIDIGIGKILQAVADRGLEDNTWIIFSSDHGEMLGDHYLMYKIVFYESSSKIPCIIRPPKGGMAQAWRSAALTDQLDVTTTILDIAGLSPMFPNRGASLRSKVLAGPGAPEAQRGKDCVFSEVGAGGQQLMVRTEAHKMNVEATSRQALELYDLEQDPKELTNLVNSPGHADVRRDLWNRIGDFIAAVPARGGGGSAPAKAAEA